MEAISKGSQIKTKNRMNRISAFGCLCFFPPSYNFSIITLNKKKSSWTAAYSEKW